MDCSICCFQTNRTTRRLITCCFCNESACLSCTKTYLLDSIHDPHCMKCRKVWPHSFQSLYLGPFLKKEYRQKREQLLVEREKAHIPAMIPVAERERRIITITHHIMMTQNEYIALFQTRRHPDEYRPEKRELKRTIRSLLEDRAILYQMDTRTTERKQFIMKCVVPDCPGFLSTRYKCGLCSVSVCPDCHVVIKENHECNPDTVATVKEIKQNTKPCPSCHIPIYKTFGCDQMWCIQCHTPFSWRTGKIEQGIIHNPHYFEFIKEKGVVPRNPLDIPCGGLPDFQTLYESLLRMDTIELDEMYFVQRIYENVTHLREITLRGLPNPQEQINNNDLLLQYLLKQITEDQWKSTLYVREQKRKRGLEERQILDAYIVIMEESFRKLVSSYTLYDWLHEIEQIKKYTKTELTKLEDQYQHKGYVYTNHIL
jgi:hypothetical protein